MHYGMTDYRCLISAPKQMRTSAQDDGPESMMDQCLRTRRSRSSAVALALVKLVTA